MVFLNHRTFADHRSDPEANFTPLRSLSCTMGLLLVALLASGCGGGQYSSDQARPVPPTDPGNAPAAPGGLSAKASQTMVALSWSAPGGGSGLSEYTVYRGVGDSCTNATELQTGIAAGTTSIEDETVMSGTTYCYQVSASNADGTGARSSGTVVTALNPPPPQALVITSSTATAIELSWSAPDEDGGGTLDGYNVFRCQEGEVPCTPESVAWVPVAEGTGYRDSDVTADVRYRYAVGSSRLDGRSDWSNEVTVVAIDSTEVANTAPRFAENASIGDLSFVAGTPIQPVILPAATGGNVDASANNGQLSDYSFDPPQLPDGLIFDRFTRVLEGAPTEAMETTEYTLWVHDDDDDYSVNDADSLAFTITVETGGAGPVESTSAPHFADDARIGDLVFTVGAAIESITLPTASGGDIDASVNGGELSDYSFDPPELPAGLNFDRFTRVLSGIPAQALETTDYTLWVHDDDADYSVDDADSLPFTLTINASEAELGGAFLQAYQYMERSDWNLARDPGGVTWNGTAWLGERVHAPLMVWAGEDEAPGPFEYEMSDLVSPSGKLIPKEQVTILFPEYVAADPERRVCNGYGSREGVNPAYLADALSTAPGPVDLPNDPFKIWLTVDVPRNACPADYQGTFIVKNGTQDATGARFAVNLNVLPLDLRAPADWQFALDLWQHPERVLTLHNDANPSARIDRWSDAHYDLLEKAYRLLASTGQKSITTTLKDGAFGTPGMVSWVRASESTDEWEFDFRVFGAHVEKLMSWGIDQRIDAYGMLGWNRAEIPYWSEELQTGRVLAAAAGSEAYAGAWQTFLPEFRTYLKEKGWFDRTYLAFDESPAELGRIIDLIHADDPNWNIVLSHFNAYLPENVAQQIDVMNVFSGIAGNIQFSRRQGQIWTLYTSCHSDPLMPVTRVNSLLTRDSNPADVEWLTWYAGKLGMDGFSRWAYDYWHAADPLDPRQGTAHTTGDFSLIYRTSNDPDLQAMSSVRFEMLRRGIQASEKRRVLRDLFTRHDYVSGLEVLDALLDDEFISAATAADGHAKDDLTRARQQLDTLSIEASSLVTQDPSCN